jgi:hypothetical protein
MSLRILLTNFVLSGRTGSELYVCDLARELLARGHHPVVYAPVLGPLAGDLRAATVPVTDDLTTVTRPPDVIHGQHNHEILTALLHFPGVPAVRVCHGWSDDRPHPFPRILRVVCVDETVADRAVGEWGVDPSRLEVMLNFVDLAAFPRRAALPVRPSRALVFSNAAARHLSVVRRACERAGMTTDAVGQSVGRPARRPGALLGAYDIVFAKARCALEAMAVGCAVVLCDEAGLGPMVTSRNFDDLRRVNFGIRALRQPIAQEGLVRAVAGYDPADAAAVSDRVRTTAGLDTAATALLGIYEEVIEQHRAARPPDADAELRAAAAYLRARGGALHTDDTLRAHVLRLLRYAYYQSERVPILRELLPSRTRARRLSAGWRPRTHA